MINMEITKDFDQKLYKLYESKVTVNLDTTSTLNAKDFWNSMELIATNYKSMINYKFHK